MGAQESEGVFWPLVWWSGALSAGVFGLVWMYWRWWPNRLAASLALACVLNAFVIKGVASRPNSAHSMIHVGCANGKLVA